MDKVTLSGYTGKAGDPIAIRAHDDFDVTAVNVAVAQADGTPIDAERGAATETPPDSGRWTLCVRRRRLCASRRDGGEN